MYSKSEKMFLYSYIGPANFNYMNLFADLCTEVLTGEF